MKGVKKPLYQAYHDGRLVAEEKSLMEIRWAVRDYAQFNELKQSEIKIVKILSNGKTKLIER